MLLKKLRLVKSKLKSFFIVLLNTTTTVGGFSLDNQIFHLENYRNSKLLFLYNDINSLVDFCTFCSLADFPDIF